VLVVGVVEPVKPEPFSGDSFPSACRVVEPVALPHGGSRGLQSVISFPVLCIILGRPLTRTTTPLHSSCCVAIWKSKLSQKRPSCGLATP
jgi:hypothetical protein